MNHVYLANPDPQGFAWSIAILRTIYAVTVPPRNPTLVHNSDLPPRRDPHWSVAINSTSDTTKGQSSP